jgi:hypothetical protein
MKILQNLNEVNTILGLLKINKSLKIGYNGRRETAIDYITLDELNTLDYEDLNVLQKMIRYENSILC